MITYLWPHWHADFYLAGFPAKPRSTEHLADILFGGDKGVTIPAAELVGLSTEMFLDALLYNIQNTPNLMRWQGRGSRLLEKALLSDHRFQELLTLNDGTESATEADTPSPQKVAAWFKRLNERFATTWLYGFESYEGAGLENWVDVLRHERKLVFARLPFWSLSRGYQTCFLSPLEAALQAEGMFLPDETGTGAKIWYDGTCYEGAWHNGKRHGSGNCKWPDGSHYEGQWQNDRRHGTGRMTDADGGSYVGAWVADYRHGRGTRRSAEGTLYEGIWKAGKLHGSGSMTCPDGSRYEGEWFEGWPHGRGLMVYADGGSYEGGWEIGRCHGMGVMTYPDGSRHEGEWRFGRRHGKGVMVDAHGVRKEGTWVKDRELLLQ